MSSVLSIPGGQIHRTEGTALFQIHAVMFDEEIGLDATYIELMKLGSYSTYI